MAIARWYDETKNTSGGEFPGVPLRDLTEDEYTGYSAWLQASIDASPMYRKTNPSPTPRKAIEKDEET